MKKLLKKQIFALLLSLGGSSAYADSVGVHVNLHLGDQSRQSAVNEQFYMPPVRAYALPVENCRTREKDVRFIYDNVLDIYVAVGVPYDLCYIQNSYYLFRDGRWLKSSDSYGPWLSASYRDLPPSLRRHEIERIREFRLGHQRRYDDSDYRRGDWKRHDQREQWRELRRENLAARR